MNLPISLTLLRILAIPVIVLIYFLPYSFAHTLAAALFALAAFTDWLDGYLARMLKLETRFGAFLDPVADKLLVAAVLVAVVDGGVVPFVVIPAIIIIGREITISALREWMAEVGKGQNVAVAYIGKIKTAIQLIALIILLALHKDSSSLLAYTGVILIWAAALMTIWSMVIYLKQAWSQFATA